MLSNELQQRCMMTATCTTPCSPPCQRSIQRAEAAPTRLGDLRSRWMMGGRHVCKKFCSGGGTRDSAACHSSSVHLLSSAHAKVRSPPHPPLPDRKDQPSPNSHACPGPLHIPPAGRQSCHAPTPALHAPLSHYLRTMPRAMSSAICSRRRSSGLNAGVRCSRRKSEPRGTNCVTMHRCGGCVTAPSCRGAERRGDQREGRVQLALAGRGLASGCQLHGAGCGAAGVRA